MTLDFATHVAMLVLVIAGICWLVQQLFVGNQSVENYRKSIKLAEESVSRHHELCEIARQQIALQTEAIGATRELIAALRERR
jgi:hypothetical protein